MTGVELRQALAAKARSQIGTVEEHGRDNRGSMVDEYNRSVGMVGTAWCAAFAAWCVKEIENGKGGRPSGLTFSPHVLTFWRSNPAARVGKLQAQTGDIALWRVGNAGLGHCGIVVTEINAHTGRFTTVEGNTSNDEMPNRDGDGVFLKTNRKLNVLASSRFQLLGFLRPWA